MPGSGAAPAEMTRPDCSGAWAPDVRRRSGATRPGCGRVTPWCSDLEDLTAVVGAADAAGGVRQLRRLALGAGHGRDRGRLPVRPAGPGVAARHLALRDGHGTYSSVFDRLRKAAQRGSTSSWL